MSALYKSQLSSKSFRRFKVVQPRPVKMKKQRGNSTGVLSKFEKEIMALEQDQYFFTKNKFDLIAKNVRNS